MKKQLPLAALFTFLLPFAFASCHQNTGTPTENTDMLQQPVFLFLSDIHLNAFDTATVSGKTDTGLDLWNNFLVKADSVIIETHPLFIVYTGDLPAHYSCDDGCFIPPAQRDTHNANVKMILEGLRSLADKHQTPLFYMPGNNDGLAGDYYSFADEQQQTPFSLVPDKKNPFPALNIKPGNAAPCMVSDPHPTMGYYSALPVEGLRLIALNTVIFSRKFVAVDSTVPDTDRVVQMNWLAAQLAEASTRNEKVYIAMHIPPGLDAFSGKHMWHGSLSNDFLALVQQYQSTIAGILYGHTHMDEVRRLYDTTGTTITEVAISCPGVTPLFGNNPGFKTVHYDRTTKELLDFTTYYTTPQSKYWGTAVYTFSSTYSAQPNSTIYSTVSTMPLANVVTDMSKIYTVMNGAPTDSVGKAVEVKEGE